MSSRNICLSPSSSPIPTISPQLMPFHIEHTGPAPVSTYFLVNPVPPSEPLDSADASLAQRVKARLTSAFRGRKVQGLTVDLPEGYSGVVFITGDEGKGKESLSRKRPVPAKNKGRKSGRITQNSKSGADEDGDIAMEEEEGTTRTLHAIGKFSSFTLWNADVDVDEGRDEYLRSLSEYQQLAAEIHRIDSLPSSYSHS